MKDPNEELQKDLADVLAKHKKTIIAVPTKIMGNDGFWHDSAEMRVVDLPESPTPIVVENVSETKAEAPINQDPA